MKDTILRENTTINCKGNLLSVASPIVMGIINCTPDSFYDGGVITSIENALSQAEKHINEGATIIDIGGYSSKPGASEVSETTELARTIPVIQSISKKFPKTIISIDTFRSSVARKAIECGAHIINDISAGELDKNMIPTAGELQVPYIMMHMKGTPQTMQQHTNYQNLTKELLFYFSERIAAARHWGLVDLIVDPGFGFDKTLEGGFAFQDSVDSGASQEDAAKVASIVGIVAATGIRLLAMKFNWNLPRVKDSVD